MDDLFYTYFHFIYGRVPFWINGRFSRSTSVLREQLAPDNKKYKPLAVFIDRLLGFQFLAENVGCKI